MFCGRIFNITEIWKTLHQSVSKKRIVVTGGGTGGHLYPGLAVADLFRAQEHEVLYVGSARGLESEVVPKEGYDFLKVPSRGLAGSPLQKIAALASMGFGTLKTLSHFASWKPDLVVGTGGFVCVPAVMAAALMKIPVVLLEQNAVPGKAIKLLSRFAKVVCTSFEASKVHFPACRTEWTGNPLRSSIVKKKKSEAREALELDPKRPTLLITGASQGATSINRAVVDALPCWSDKPWNILHLTGRNHLARVKARTENVLTQNSTLIYKPFGFRKDMENLYSAADLVVTRAGATTIAEISMLGLPAIFVPYPFAGGHQKENAKVVVDSRGGTYVSDSDVGEKLRAEVEMLMGDKTLLKEMSTNSLETARPDASQCVIDICCELMN